MGLRKQVSMRRPSGHEFHCNEIMSLSTSFRVFSDKTGRYYFQQYDARGGRHGGMYETGEAVEVRAGGMQKYITIHAYYSESQVRGEMCVNPKLKIYTGNGGVTTLTGKWALERKTMNDLIRWLSNRDLMKFCKVLEFSG